MITIYDIEKKAYQPSIPRAYELFRKGSVNQLTIQNDPPLVTVSARMSGSQSSPYHISATINESANQILDYNCDCPAYEEYSGMCKHCVAMLLSYLRQRDSQKTQPMTKKNMLTTNSTVKNMLKFYGVQEKIPFLQPEIYGKVQLVPSLSYQQGHMFLELKIGVSKLYVVKSIRDFVDAVEQSDEYTYGKGLSFYHKKETFTKESIPLVEFVCQMFQSNEISYSTYSYSYGYSYDYGSSKYRTILLRGFALDRFISLHINKELMIHLQGAAEDYLVQEKNPPSILKIKGGTAGISLEVSRYNAFEGAEYIYYLYSNVLYMTKKVERESLNFFRSCFNSARDRKLFIAKQELPIFCRELLPQLKQQYEIEQEGFDELCYLPEQAAYEIYLDMPQTDFIEGKIYAVYQNQKYNIFEEAKVEQNRDVKEECQIAQKIKPFFNAYEETAQALVLFGNEELLYQFLYEGIPKLHEYGEVHISENIRKLKILPTPRVKIGVSIEGNLLEFEMQSEDMPIEELAEILSKYNRKKHYYRLKDGTFIQMGKELDGVLHLSQMLQLKQSDLQKGMVSIPKYRALYLDGTAKEYGMDIKKDRNFKNLVRNMKTAEENDFEIPNSLDSILRNYQKAGFLWLRTLMQNGFGGILADDMGLGKTLQVITLLQAVYDEQKKKQQGEKLTAQKKKSSLAFIVTPASLVYNWKNELEHFAPDLFVVMITGSAQERALKIKEAAPEQILITSYDLLKRDLAEYKKKEFQIQVIDEAQYIKNASAQAAKAVKSISAGFKVALTGTPIENRLSELWSIFDYLLPGFLYHYPRFRQEFETPIVGNENQEAMSRLKRMIQPFVLRRLKQDVLTDLPDKLEKVVYANLEGEQKKLYQAHVGRLKLFLENQSEAELKTAKIYVLSELTKLRQLCCNPSLLYEDYKADSAKLELCMETIKTAAEGGHKVLVFSQFTSNFELLEKRLEEEQISWYRLTGATKKEERIALVEQFNRNQVLVFLISLKAGGTGLNLTAADIVIHFDPWWNLAVQNQATDRAHRIGQKNIVTVYKLIMKDTIEEKILALQEKKRDLAEQVLGGEGMGDVGFSKEELLELLQ